MEQYRRKMINDMKMDRKRLEKTQERDIEALANLPAGVNTGPLIRKKIEDRKIRIAEVKQRCEDAESGLLNQEFENSRLEELRDIEQKIRAANYRIQEKKAEKREKNDNRESRYREDRQCRSDERQLKRDIRYSFKHYNRSAGSLPDYMRRNLADMPGNKGYIWRSVWFMGDLREERGKPRIMFEKCKGGILKIHEYTKYEYKLYEKKGKNRKVLVKQERRNRDFLNSFNKKIKYF